MTTFDTKTCPPTLVRTQSNGYYIVHGSVLFVPIPRVPDWRSYMAEQPSDAWLDSAFVDSALPLTIVETYSTLTRDQLVNEMSR